MRFIVRCSHKPLCSFYYNHIIQIGGVLLGHIFILQMPFLVKALDCHPYGIVTILPIGLINGFRQCSLLFTIYRIKQIALNGFILADVP